VDEDYWMAAARYVALNPAPARLVGRAWDWPHSSVKRASGRPRRRARARGKPLIDRAPRFACLLDMVLDSTIPR